MSSPPEPVVEFPAKLQCLFEPKRYKILHGGRGGAKSWGIARALLVKGAERPLRILCAREIQKSIKDSVHQLLTDQVSAMGMDGVYDVLNAEIRGKNGTLIVFEGLKHNVKNIKSLEGLDICWVEEAQTVSKSSWETLIPTVRKDGSEIWVSFNPELETDDTYKRFVLSPPTDSIVVKVTHQDNPWFPAVLKQEMADLKEKDYDAYLNVWEGHCRQTLDGAIFANEIRLATKEERFTRVPWDAGRPVDTFWDLGRADMTAIWFCQQVGFEYRIIDYYENQGPALPHYIKVLKERPYQYETVWLPHDAESELLASELTIEQQVRAAGLKPRIVPKLTIAQGIEAARAIFSKCYFDAVKCADGIQALTHYRYDVDPDTKEYSQKPLHDWASHGADAFRYMALALKPDKKDTWKQPSTKWVT